MALDLLILCYHTSTINLLFLYNLLDSTPDIIKGSFEEPPIITTDGPKSVNIGTPVYVLVGNHVIIQCDVYSEIQPITTVWLRNGRSYGRENDSSIIIDVARNGDVFSCLAKNCKGFDIMNTTIFVSGK